MSGIVDAVSNARPAGENDTAQARRGSGPPPSGTTVPSQTAEAPKAALQSSDVRLEIEQKKSIGTFVYKLVDNTTGELIRQWPTKEMLQLREFLRDQQIKLLDKTI